MSDNTSSYPSAIDPQPVTLVDDIDFVSADALAYAISAIAAIQAELGTSPVDFTAGGALDYGTIGAFLVACSRIELGQTTTADSKTGFRVDFTTNRFTAPPFVFCQLVQASAPGQYMHWHARRITRDGFTLASSHTTRSAAAGHTIDWIAIQPPFGLERTTEEDEN